MTIIHVPCQSLVYQSTKPRDAARHLSGDPDLVTIQIQRLGCGQHEGAVSLLGTQFPGKQCNHNHGAACDVVTESEAILDKVIFDVLVGSEDLCGEASALYGRFQVVLLGEA
jgi:hypothetical protein